jgi:RimJ/RimL family protein N-acetyltransferase
VPSGPELQTERLLLRRWRQKDRAPWASMSADPLVMEHFPSLLSAAESDAFVDRMEACFEERGYGLWAVELRGTAAFVGCVGLLPVDIDAHFTPAIEVGWRLARAFWGRGIATEAAIAAISFGFDELALTGIVAFTAARNLPSRRVMARLGMLRDPAEDFLHRDLPPGNPLAPHVLYRTDPALWGAWMGE